MTAGAFREPLDLSDFMGHYQKIVGPPARGVRLAPDEESINSPILIGENAVCSSSKELMTTGPQVCYDVNGYYRELGVQWKATRKQLREAYQAANGENSPRLTYIIKQLLNDETRARYDEKPLGSIFMDEYVGDWLKRKAIEEAARRSKVQYTSPEDVLDEWGFLTHTSDAEDLIEGGETHQDSDAEDLDRDELRRQDEPSQVEYHGRWMYGYYLWRSLCDDTGRLAVWQAFLVDALDAQGATTSFAVGFVGKQPHPYVVGIVSGGVYVLYLNDSLSPDPDVASRAASALLREMKESRRQPDKPRPDKNRDRQEPHMTATTTKPVFSKGGKAAEEADEIVRKAGGKQFSKVTYLSIEADDYQIVRYLTDSPDWVYVKQHAGAPTKNGPADYTGTWPTAMPATCRHDKAFAGIYTDCYICDEGLINKWGRKCNPQIRVWAIAALREEVIGTQEMADAGNIPQERVGFLVGCRDVVRQVEETDDKGDATGNTIEELALVVVNQPVNNYFGGLNSAYGTYGSVCDRDFKVERKGVEKDTEYHNIALDKTPNLKPGTEKWARYDQAIADQKLDLGEIIADKASDDYFARFFDPTKTVETKSGNENKSAPAAQQAAAPSNEPDPNRLQAMRDRVKGVAPQAAPAADAPVAAVAAMDDID